MRLGFELNLEQSQKLIMTPELRQAIQMLQFTSQELYQFIETEMEINPLLEMENKNNKTENIDDYKDKNEDIDWKEYLGKYDDISYKGSIKRQKNESQGFESYLSSKVTLREHLLFQLNLTVFSDIEREVGELIIESINKNGYLNTNIEEIASQVSVEIDKVENVLKVIQTFDPIGVASRTLQECLLVQLEIKKQLNDNIKNVINNHLGDVAKNRISNISKELNIQKKEAQGICDLIKTLEPKPGRGFASDEDDIKFITPDLTLEFIDGEYIIILNDSTAPRLNINKYYKQLLSKSKEENISQFLNDKLNSAMWIIRSIEQRRMTIYNVAKSIVKFQKDFFDMGKKHLKPLTLKEVAEDIDVHESTVSRATTGKYIQTPRGIFELKFFFTSGVEGQGGGVSSTSIKSMIEELIEKEKSEKPLSDQSIANLLKEKNIKISRRTVAKYRDELRIPSSSGRRRY
ncbi:MAG: RNA polymerase factor sigma-54 [Firmicutes bacterium]|nr:RNA polymerase factor sigma-54 [Bacillota bacterium]